jgi:hypothetical protein
MQESVNSGRGLHVRPDYIDVALTEVDRKETYWS